MRLSYPIRFPHIYLLLHRNSPKYLPDFPRRYLIDHHLPLRLSSRSLRHFTMAGDSESFSTTAVDESAKFGFERAEMYKSSLAGTVDPYDRHVFLCYKSHETWPARIEDSEADPLPKQLASAFKARKNDFTVKTRVTICEQIADVVSDGDVLIFPEKIIYRGLKESEVDSFVEDVLVCSKPWQSRMPEQFSGSYVFVCAHNNRDRRCGVCGPILIEKFKEEAESRGLKDQVTVTACSHVGGHKYAGNVIIFSADPDGNVVGNWYGYVTPNDVPELFDEQIERGEIIDRMWRGKMGPKVDEGEKVEEPKLANGSLEKEPKENATEEKGVASCCQGVRGFSCCRDENVDAKAGKKEEGGVACWSGKWEQRQVITTVGVAGALAAIALAYYGFYRRAR